MTTLLFSCLGLLAYWLAWCPKHHVPAKNIYSNFISTLSPSESVPPASHRPIRAITTKFGPVSLEKEVSHAETPDLLQMLVQLSRVL